MEIYHYGIKGMKWGVRKSIIDPKKRPWGPVITERYEKSERQKQYEDDNGINPHRPNGTPSRGDIINKAMIEKGRNYLKKKWGIDIPIIREDTFKKY